MRNLNDQNIEIDEEIDLFEEFLIVKKIDKMFVPRRNKNHYFTNQYHKTYQEQIKRRDNPLDTAETLELDEGPSTDQLPKMNYNQSIDSIAV